MAKFRKLAACSVTLIILSSPTLSAPPLLDSGETGYKLGCVINYWLNIESCQELSYGYRKPKQVDPLPPGHGVLAPGGGSKDFHQRSLFELCLKVPCMQM